MLSKIFKKIKKHKFSAAVVIVVLIGGGYFGYLKFFGAEEPVRYELAEVSRGDLVISVSGSGQTSASNQIDIKPKVSGEIIYVGARDGQYVGAETLLAQIDSRDAGRAARDAEVNLESAKITLLKLKKPADALSLLQQENALTNAKQAKQKAEDDLKKSYDDGFNTVSNTFLDLPAIITGLHDTLYNTDFTAGQWNIDYYVDAIKNYDSNVFTHRENAYNFSKTARNAYDKNFDDYKTATRFSDTATVDNLINQTYDTTKSAAEALKRSNNLIQFYKDKLADRGLKPDPKAETALANLNTYTSKANLRLLELLSTKNTIQNDKDSIISSERLVNEKTESLAKLKEGADALDIQSAELAIKQRENALLDAREKLTDYSVRAPFSGVIAKMNAKKSDSATPGTALAVLITRQQLAEISLNEVDAAKVKVGQKAAPTFDAVPGLFISGQVVEIDIIGTVSQGVVTYIVKAGFSAQDERVKPGMSVSAEIITEVRRDVLLVPNLAVKTRSGESFVEITRDENINLASARGMALKNSPSRESVEVGLANDDFTEITKGIEEGDTVVVRAVQSASSNQSLQISGVQRGGVRIPGLPGGGRNR